MLKIKNKRQIHPIKKENKSYFEKKILKKDTCLVLQNTTQKKRENNKFAKILFLVKTSSLHTVKEVSKTSIS